MKDISEIQVLIDLLDDPDDTVFEQVRKKLLSYGSDAIEILEDTLDTVENHIVRERIEDIIHNIRYENLINEILDWTNSEKRLIDGYIILSKYKYPEIDSSNIYKKISKIVKDVWLEINDELTALEKIKVLNHIFFEIHKFKVVHTDEFQPQHCYINKILQTHRGSNLSLAIIYAIIADELEIPVKGVNLPEHFILAYENDSEIAKKFFGDDILFYINIVNKGSALSKKEIDMYINDLKIEPKEEYYNPCSNKDIMKLLLDQLVIFYKNKNKTTKVEELEALKDLF